MKAKDAIDGQFYSLPARGQSPAYARALCSGWNHNREWLLFLVYDAFGRRKVTLVMPNQEIATVNP